MLESNEVDQSMISPNAVPEAMRQEEALSHEMCAQYRMHFDPETSISVEMLADSESS